MTNFVGSSDAFFQGLSSFWTRLFADTNIIKGLYAGSAQQLGQVYLDLLESVLSTSLNDAPVFHKEYWKLLTVNTDQLFFDGQLYIASLPTGLTNFEFLLNKIYAPTVTLQNTYDFSLVNGQLKFGSNPFSIAGIPSRFVNITPTTKQSGVDGKLSGSTFSAVSASFDALSVGRTVTVSSFNQSGTYQIISVVSPTSVTLNGSFSTETNLKWTYQSATSVQELAFWIPDAMIDVETLYDRFGYFISVQQASSESYRALIRGIFQLYVLGSSLERIEAALNAAVELPLIQETTETIQAIDSVSVTTDQHVYQLAASLQKSTLQVGQTLQAFAPLSNVFRVTDYIADPTWWWNIVIPENILPNENSTRRTVTPTLYENRYGNPDGQVFYGDPGLYYGADDDGYVPAVTYDSNGNVTSGRPGFRHVFGYTVMDKFLKYQMLGIFSKADVVDQDVFNQLVQTLVDVAKSAYITVYAINQLSAQEIASALNPMLAIPSTVHGAWTGGAIIIPPTSSPPSSWV